MRIITLSDNTSQKNDLRCEHGLSVYIETEKHKVLFDTGKSDIFIQNAIKLKIDLKEIDTLIISHGHYDHLGGLIYFLKLNNSAKIYLKKEIFNYQYSSIRKNLSKEIGYSHDLLSYKNRFTFINEDIMKLDELIIIPKIEHTYSLPLGNNILYKYNNKSIEKDDFAHELIFAIDAKDGIYLFSGCAHNGILNMISTLKTHFPTQKIKMIFGGLHLIDRSENVETETNEEILNIATEMNKLTHNSLLFTGHCTGSNALMVMKKILKERIDTFYVGKEIIT